MIIELFLWALLIVCSPMILLCALITLALMLLVIAVAIYCTVELVKEYFKFIIRLVMKPFTKAKKNDIEP